MKLDHAFIEYRGGIIQIYRPNIIGGYNDNMGGFDISDMRRLYLKSVIMGIHLW